MPSINNRMRKIMSQPRPPRAFSPGWLILASLCALPIIPAAAARAAEDQPTAIIGHLRLARVYHTENLLPDREHSGFGSLLYDQRGELVLHQGTKTWLYTTALLQAPTNGQRDWYGKWVSNVREFDVKTLVSGPSHLVLALSGADRWAIIHDVLKISDHLFVAFYSANGTVRAAIAKTPDGLFNPVADFRIEATDPWETQGGTVSSVESNGAHVLIEEAPASLTLWLGYDSYHVDATAGQLGWAKISIDKRTGTVALMAKHPGNPLPLLPSGYIAARCGGNLASNIRFGKQHVLFYYSRPSKQKIMLTAALSDDPLFQHVTRIVELEPPLGEEQVIEKFEAYLSDDGLHIIYENELASGHWGTGMRIYRMLGD